MMMCAALCLVLEWIENGFFVCGTVADDSQNIQIGALLDVKGSNTKASVLGDRFFTKKVQTVVDTITTWGHLKDGDANQTVIPENNNKETGRDNAANETEGLRLLIQASLQTLIQ